MSLPPNIPRQKAKEAGEKFFMPEKPCKHGHLALKWVSNNECTECIKIRTSDPEFKAKMAKKSLELWYKDKDKRREIIKKSNRKHKDKLNAKSKAWRAKNPDKFKLSGKKSRIKRYPLILANNAQRRAMRLQATPNWLTSIHKAQIQEFYDIAIARNMQTGIKHDVDHIIPLIHNDVVGLHVPWNLQVLTRRENRIKSNKLELNYV